MFIKHLQRLIGETRFVCKSKEFICHAWNQIARTVVGLLTVVQNVENHYLQFKVFHSFFNQVAFFSVCERLILRPRKRNDKDVGLIGLNTLLFYYVLSYFAAKVYYLCQKNLRDAETNRRNVVLCLVKIILEWTKAIVAILCLKEQGLQFTTNGLFLMVTAAYYLSTEKIFKEMSPLLLKRMRLKMDNMEDLYAPVFTQAFQVLASASVGLGLLWNQEPLFFAIYNYHTVYLELKDMLCRTLQLLLQEKAILRKFREATRGEINEYNDICAVCLMPMPEARVTPCRHLFHGECLRQCYKSSPHCPLCKMPLQQD